MANPKLGINLAGLASGRLSGVGQYSVRLFEALVDLLGETNSQVALTGFIRPDARHHLSNRSSEYLQDLQVAEGRVRRVIFDHSEFPIALRRAGIDVLVNPAFTGPLWGAKRHVPVVHDLYFRVIPELLESRQRKYLSVAVPLNLRRAWRVITDSHSSARDLARFYPFAADRIRVAHLAGRFGEAIHLPIRVADTSDPYALLVSSMTANKNPTVAVEAVAHVRASGRRMRLLHIGADSNGLLAGEIERHGAHDFCTMLGTVDDPTLIRAFQNATCLIVPSLYEGFGLPVLEGQQLGVPVISSDRSSLPEVGGEAALYFDPVDAQACANHIIALIDSPSFGQALVKRGFDNAKQFSWRATAKQTLMHIGLS